MPDQLVRAMAADGTVLGFAAVTTHTVDEARRRHATAPTATAAIGRALTATAMLGAALKDGQRLTVRILADGPLGGMITNGNATGEVRGYVANPAADLPLTPARKLDVGGVVGRGTLHVTKELGMRFPYHGSVPLVTGEIGEDFAHYLAVSEQVPSVVALGVLVAPDGRVLASGGFMVHVLPGAAPEVARYLEDRAALLPAVTQLVHRGDDALGILELAMGDLRPHPLEARDVMFRCGCSRERVEAVLIALGRSELERLLADEGQAEVQCRFCGDRYVLEPAEVERLFSQPA